MMKIKTNGIGLCLALGVVLSCEAAYAERTGEEVFKATCIACHTAGMSAAPTAHHLDAWKPFITTALTKAKVANITFDEKNLAQYATLLLPFVKAGQSIIPGKGVMPSHGTCMDCSDAELTATILFMLTPEKPKT